MRSKFVSAAAFVGAFVLAMPAVAQESAVPQADQIIEALSMPQAPTAGVRIKGGGRGLQITPVETPSMNFNVTFQLGSAILTPQAMTVLDELGVALTSDALSQFDFKIAGHTDASGPEMFNLQLSEQRAQAVEDYLAARYGIDRGRLITIGMGERSLLDAGNPSAPQNRRVEITNIGTPGG